MTPFLSLNAGSKVKPLVQNHLDDEMVGAAGHADAHTEIESPLQKPSAHESATAGDRHPAFVAKPVRVETRQAILPKK